MKFRPFALILAGVCMFAGTSRAGYDLIPLGSSGWKYLIATQEVSNPITAWRAVGYDDSSWSNGQTPIGFPSPVDRVGYENSIATMIRGSATEPTWTSVYFRKHFTITNLAGIGSLLLNVYVDDGAVAWINGVEVGRINVAAGDLLYNAAATLAEEERLMSLSVTNVGSLVVGDNVLTIHGLNGSTNSSDFHVEVSLATVDDVPPTVTSIDPPAAAKVPNLTFINVIFSEGVSGVEASDLLINNLPATSIVTNNPNDYTFYFPQPPTGAVSVAFAASHGIADTDALPTPFAGGSWGYTLDPNAVSSQFVISEFMPDNQNGIQDEDGNTSDWIEIYNPTAGDGSLAGWYLTDRQGSNMWRFPSHINMTLGANQYLIVWASSKNRTNNITRLHTNFDLRQNGEYLGLLDPQGHPVSEFAPTYPRVETDRSYGRDRVDPSLVGFFDNPTPGRANSNSGTNYAAEPVFSLDSGVYTNDSLVVSLSISGGGPGEIRYTIDGTEPTNNSPLYTAPLTISSNVFVKARVFVSTPGIWPSKVIPKTYFLLDATARDFTSNLPIIVINTSGRSVAASVPPGDNAPRTRGSLIVMDTYRGRASLRGKPDYLGMAQFELFGQTSLGFAKQPWNIELNDAYGNDEAHSLLGLPKESDWKMRNPWSDKCLMNDFLSFELYDDMGHYSVRRRMVEVFVCAPTSAGTNTAKISYPGSYYGVLCFVEKIEQAKNRVDIEELTPAHTTEPEIAGGYMFKKDKDSVGDINFTIPGGQGHSGEGLKFHEPKPRDITVAQQNWLINYLTRMSQSLYASDWLTRTGTNHYSYYIDVDNFVDQHWIIEFCKQIDGYRLSNYMNKSRYGKVQMSPIWDFNLAFGNANYLEGGRTNGWYWNIAQEGMTSAEHIWLRRLIYGTNNIIGTGGAAAGPGAVMHSGDPEFIQRLIDRWGVLRTNVMNGDRVVARIDQIATLLTESAARNYQKYPILTVPQWPEPDGTGAWNVKYDNQPTYAAIISEMKKWTRGRFNWLDAQIVRTPTIVGAGQVTSGTSLTMGAPAGSTLYYTLDGTDPRLPGGTVSLSAKVYTQPILVTNNVRAFARARIGTNQYSWSPPAMSSMFTSIPGLRITEIMYHPADPPQPSSFTDEDFEYIELRNTSAGSLNINGYRISGGIDFVFPNITLNAGQRVVVVKNMLAFSALYNTNGMIVAGEFANQAGNTNNLDNTGERLVLTGRLGEPILDFRYDDDWYKITDGLGFSLVIVDDSLPTSAWNDATSWRPGGVLNGTPGAGEPAPTAFPQVVISEALTHTDLPTVDAIELQNLSGSSADISGWYLSDDRLTPRKYRIPAGTIIAPGDFVTFNENQFNAGGTGFALSSSGDEVYLASADGPGNLTGYLHGFDFGAQANGVTFGRYVNSIGKEHFVSQAAATLNGANAGPLVGNVVISEIHYHPPDVFTNGNYWNNSEDEYVELRNRSGSPVNLYFPSAPSIPWRLNRAVEFDFPPGTTIPANGYLLVVNFNPTTEPNRLQDFRARFNVPGPVQIFGPYQGDLSNGDEAVALFTPDTPFTNGNNVVEVPYVLVEQVAYADSTPWPLAADGSGFSLHRRVLGNYANDPINWEASAPTPGQGYTPGTAPTITSQPGNISVLESNSVTLSVTASGGPLRYQWRKNGENLSGKTNASLILNPAQLADSGDYQVLVLNNTSFAASTPATLTVVMTLKIQLQPESLTVRPPTNLVFSVGAFSSNPVRYQWRFNGNDLPGETNALLFLNNVTNIHDGVYTVVCRDGVSVVETAPARLTVLIAPLMVWPSPADPVRISAVVGETINMGAQLHGTLPIFSRWRLTRITGGTITLGDTISQQLFTTMTHVVATNSAGRVLLSITNIAGGSLATSAVVTNAILTVLADTDGDGIPDAYEDANGMDKNSAADANLDSDGDTMKNKDEYIAGTDPRDPTSYLKVDHVATIGSAFVYFGAVSNRTYTVQYSDSLSPPSWQRLADFGGRTTNWSATAIDPSSSPSRFYRLVTPVVP